MEYFVCDHDVLFSKQFEEILESSDVKLLMTRMGTPQQNGFAERFVKSIKEGCLNKLIFYGEKFLKRAVNEHVEHYHQKEITKAWII
ncbi:MAG: transposase [Puniceicoccaceae bacterium]|nr:transposase [Puniceicoccaceae bacterium]MBL6829721.1 transposase [Puniceicoccaceae bacterium]MBL6920362.1 transposase [Puniceicoccaceae bacterium]